jgi:hypothetical protein
MATFGDRFRNSLCGTLAEIKSLAELDKILKEHLDA